MLREEWKASRRVVVGSHAERVWGASGRVVAGAMLRDSGEHVEEMK